MYSSRVTVGSASSAKASPPSRAASAMPPAARGRGTTRSVWARVRVRRGRRGARSCVRGRAIGEIGGRLEGELRSSGSGKEYQDRERGELKRTES